jgi:hypothetical protein
MMMVGNAGTELADVIVNFFLRSYRISHSFGVSTASSSFCFFLIEQKNN